MTKGRRKRGGRKKGRRADSQTAEAADQEDRVKPVSDALAEVQQLTSRPVRPRRARDSSANAMVETTPDYSSTSDERETDDLPSSPAESDTLTQSSYAPTAEEPKTEDLRYRALSGDIYRDVSDFKTSTLKWVMGIVLAGMLALIGVTLTMNESLRDDVATWISELREDIRRDTERLEGDIEEVNPQIDEMRETPPSDTLG